MSETTTELTPQNSALNRVPILEADNWSIFNRRAREFLILAGYDDLLEDDDGVPEQERNETAASWSRRSKAYKSKVLRACTAIRSRCGTNAHALVEDCMTLNQVMDTLEEKCKNQGTGSLIELVLEFWSLRLKDYKSVTEYAERFRDLNKELAAIAEKAVRPDLDMVIKFIDGLDASYDIFKANFLQNRIFIKKIEEDNVAIVSFDVLVRASLTEEKRLRQVDERTAALALVAAPSLASDSATTDPNTRIVPYCTRCHVRGHNLDQCYAEHPEKAPKGWKKLAARRKARNKSKGTPSKRAKNHKAVQDNSSDSDSDIAAPAFGGDFVAAPSTEDLADNWLLDTGCSRHSNHKLDDFIDYKPLDSPKPIKGIGGIRVTPTGVGTVRIPTKGGKNLVLSEVYYVPEMGLNLISPGQLEEKGYDWGRGQDKGQGEGNGMWFEVKGRRFTSTKKNNVYLLDLDPKKLKKFRSSPPTSSIFDITKNPDVPSPALFALAAYSIAPELIIWHERMAHLGEENLKKLPKAANGVKLYKHHKEKCTCQGCIYGAMRRRPHNKASKPGRYPMEFVVYDLVYCPVRGAKGEHYFGHIMCQKTKWGDTKCFKSKAEALDYWKEFKARYQRPGQKIRRVRLDNGELKSKAFHEDCAADGIIHEETVPNNPEQNGASERHGQTIWRKVSTILQTAGIPEKHWPEIVNTACYLANRSPHSALKGMTPYEALNGCKPDLHHVRTLGSTAYNLVGSYKKKLQDRADEGKLVGYDGDSIYRILLPDGKIIRGSNVHIDERIPPGYVPRGKRKDRSDVDSGESLRESSDESLQHLAKRFKFIPTFQAMVEDSDDDDDAILKEPHIEPQGRRAPPQHLRTEAYEDMVRTTLSPSNQHSRLPLAPPTHEPQTPESAGSHDELALWALVAEANPTEPTEPKTYKQARNGGQWALWKLAAKEEYASLQENGTWKLVDRPKDRKVLQGKWVWRLKRGSQNQVIRHKARYVIRGDMQQEGIDFFETFASVVKPMSYKAIFAIVAAQDWELEQMDVKTAFLYGPIDTPIYMEQPQGCNDGSGRVCLLQRALYGLKQAPRIWYNTLATFLKQLGLEPLDSDMSVFHGNGLIVAVYVDDLLIAGPDMTEIDKLKKGLSDKFRMEDLGPCSYYLGMKVTRDRPNRTIKLSQKGYLEKVLKDFGMWDCNTKHDTPMETSPKHMVPETKMQASVEDKRRYQSAVGSLMYAMLGTRPDIAFAVSVVSRFASNPNDHHMKAVKRIFRYLRGTIDLELTFSGDLGDLTGYTDADWAGDLDTRRSTNGYVFHIGSGTISWSAKRQLAVALSSCEAEYMGQTQAIKEAIWLKNFLAQVHSSRYGDPVATIIFCDNQGAMALARNPQFHGRSKHMGIQLNWQREQVEKGEVELQYTPTERQIADGMTKALCRDKFVSFRKALGVI
jgi:Reverse transcriptase (RNA-dependent DNA polymerase)/gag-polypeptide of LTR copia-type